MKRIVCIFCLIAVCVLPFSVFAVSEEDFVTSVTVIQSNTSHVGWYQMTPTHYGDIYGGSVSVPFSLVSMKTSTSVHDGSTLSPTSVIIDISNPALQHPCVVYLGIVNGYGVFRGSTDVATMWQWNDTIPGYVFRGTPSSSLGYLNPTSFLTPYGTSNWSVGVKQIVGGGQGNGGYDLTYSTPITGSVGFRVPATNGTGSVYNSAYWLAEYPSYHMIRFVTAEYEADQFIFDTVRVTLDTSDLVRAYIKSGGSSDYLQSAIFIPVAIVIPVSDVNSQILADLDNIVGYLSDIATDSNSISVDVSAIAGYLHSGNTTVISALSSIVSQLQNINSKMSSVTGNRYSSSVQYIEYYLGQVLTNTNTMVEQLNDITSTLSSIASTIQSTNEQAEELTGSAEEVHEQEQVLFAQANSSIGSTVIGSFAFDPDTSVGMGRVGIDFTNLWNALGNWHNVYIFAMTLTLAFTIIRFSSSRARAKDRSNKSKQGN